MKKLFKVDTDHEAFLIVKDHLLTQKRRCGHNNDMCFYDGNKSGNKQFLGKKCAIGALLTDEALNEFGSFGRGVVALCLEASLQGFETGNLNERMLVSLQKLHDSTDLNEWELTLEKVKDKYLS